SSSGCYGCCNSFPRSVRFALTVCERRTSTNRFTRTESESVQSAGFETMKAKRRCFTNPSTKIVSTPNAQPHAIQGSQLRHKIQSTAPLLNRHIRRRTMSSLNECRESIVPVPGITCKRPARGDDIPHRVTDEGSLPYSQFGFCPVGQGFQMRG